MNNISILISVYYKDNCNFLFDAINSIITQSLPPKEIVLVKDGPLTVELNKTIDMFVEKYPSLFNVISLETNKGLGEALSIGLINCKYEYVARMDSDDISFLDRLKIQYDYLTENPEIDLIGSNIEEFRNIPGDLKTIRKLPEYDIDIKRISKFRNPLNHPSIMFKKSKVLIAGNYKSNYLLFEDYFLFIRMIRNNCKFYNLQSPLLYFRIGNKYDMLNRRRGINYIILEHNFLKYLFKIKYINNFEFGFLYISKMSIRLLPTKILYIFYKIFLRSNK